MSELKFYQFGEYLVNMQNVVFMRKFTNQHGAQFMNFYFAAPYGSSGTQLIHIRVPMEDYLATRERIEMDQAPTEMKPPLGKGYWDE